MEKTLSEAMEFACEHLPLGWAIEIYMESGWWSIELRDADGDVVDFDSELTVTQQIIEAVNTALSVTGQHAIDWNGNPDPRWEAISDG